MTIVSCILIIVFNGYILFTGNLRDPPLLDSMLRVILLIYLLFEEVELTGIYNYRVGLHSVEAQ